MSQHAGTANTSSSDNSSRSVSRRNRKIAAIAAGILVVGVGATYTLASWTDSEWVWGGTNGAAGIGTSSFNIEQHTYGTTDPANDWRDMDVADGGELQFSLAPLALTPGDTIYAPVSLRADETSIGGTVQLNAAIQSTLNPGVDTGGLLWNAIELTVYTSSTAAPATCAADVPGTTSFDAADWDAPIITGQPLATVASADQTLLAGADTDAGAPQHYCFQLTLPSDAQTEAQPETLMGRTIAPVWQFAATSD